MSKKHFIRLAEYIRDAEKYTGRAFTADQIDYLADFCHEQNPHFDRARFLGYITGKNGPSGGATHVGA